MKTQITQEISSFIHLFTVDRLSWDLDHEQELKKLVRTKVD